MNIQLSLIIKLLSQVRNYRTSSLDSLYECNVSDHLIIIMNQDWYPINYSIKKILCTIRIHIYSMFKHNEVIKVIYKIKVKINRL